MNERLERLLDDSKTIPIAVGVVSLGTGLGIGYILGKRNRTRYIIPSFSDSDANTGTWTDVEEIRTDKTEMDVNDIPPEQVDKGKRFTTDTLEDVVVVRDEIHEEVAEELELEPVRQSIFTDVVDDWDQDEEIKNRTLDSPYVITKDEFYANDTEYAQRTLTYYAGDEILADEEESPIYNPNNVIGPLRFGHGSGDPNVFYARNDKLKAEYEVLQDKGLYSVEVLGLEMEERTEEIKHSTQRKFKKD